MPLAVCEHSNLGNVCTVMSNEGCQPEVDAMPHNGCRHRIQSCLRFCSDVCRQAVVTLTKFRNEGLGEKKYGSGATHSEFSFRKFVVEATARNRERPT